MRSAFTDGPPAPLRHAILFRLGPAVVAMKFLFDDESFTFEALRTARFANYGGAELGEVAKCW